MKYLLVVFFLFVSLVDAAESISLSGTIEPAACATGCGVCCATHVINESSGALTISVGNSFSPLESISDGLTLHHFTGRYFQTRGQCNVGECTLFQIESVDQAPVSEPVYDPQSQELQIPSAGILDSKEHYQLVLKPPFNSGSLVQLTEQGKIAQGESCAETGKQCAAGTACLEYYGIAGASGPLFKSCEIPCSLPGASCPSGQACVNIADGPGQVCRTQ